MRHLQSHQKRPRGVGPALAGLIAAAVIAVCGSPPAHAQQPAAKKAPEKAEAKQPEIPDIEPPEVKEPAKAAAVAKEQAGAEQAAAEGGAPAAPTGPAKQPGESFIGWMIRASGFFFFPQLAISIGLIALITTNLLAIRRRNFVAAQFSHQFETLVREKKFNEAFELAKAESSLVGRLVAAGLQRLSTGYAQAIEAMQEVGEEENMKYEHRLSYLALIGNIATLVGLLGTVWGMVMAFMVIGQSDVAPKPSELARGVSQALVTTVMGLTQAIPAIIFFTVLKNRVASLVLEVGVVSERLMQRFKGVVARRAGEGHSSGSTSS